MGMDIILCRRALKTIWHPALRTAVATRNCSLAACQLRDAGYSQPDAERELIPRHLASGSSEREALATIQSVFSRPARNPIPDSHQVAQEWVAALVRQFRHDSAEPQRP